MKHFGSLRHGTELHAHVHRCINCGSPEGESVLSARLHRTAAGSALERGQTGNSLCPQCRAKLMPMTDWSRDELDRLTDNLWRELMNRGCPCCQSGLEWYPVTHAH